MLFRSQVISPFDSTWIHISYGSSVPESSAIDIVILSNSSSLRDTITVVGISPRLPYLMFNEKSIDFGDRWLDILRYKTSTFENIGFIPLAFDSVISLNSAFGVYFRKTSFPLGQKVIDSVWFKPVVTGRNEGKIIFYSNASNSPETLFVSGNGIGGVGRLSAHVLNFGYVSAGTYRDSVLLLNHYGVQGVQVDRIINPNSSFDVRSTRSEEHTSELQ